MKTLVKTEKQLNTFRITNKTSYFSEKVNSPVNLIDYKQKSSFEVFNQTTELLGIKYLGKTISKEAKKLGSISKVKIIKNPRVEKENHQMEMENKNFLKILSSTPQTFSDECSKIVKKLMEHKLEIKKFKKSFI